MQMQVESMYQDQKRQYFNSSEYSRENKRQLKPHEINFRKNTIEWILKANQRAGMAKDTIYLAISYLDKLLFAGLTLGQLDVQSVSLGVLLISGKVNQITPPALSGLIRLASRYYTKEDIIKVQAGILEKIDYDIIMTDNIYSDLMYLLETENQISNVLVAEKILTSIISKQIILHYDSINVAAAILYLVKPSILRKFENNQIVIIKQISKQIIKEYKKQN